MPPLSSAQYIGYGLAAIVMFAVGAGVAIAFSEPRTVRSAMALGMTLPSLFQIGGLQAGDSKGLRQAEAGTRGEFALIASTFAGEPENFSTARSASMSATESLAPNRKLEVSAPNSSVSDNLSVRFLDNNSHAISVVPAKRGLTSLDVPSNAAAVQFQKDNSLTDPKALTTSPSSVQSANVMIREGAGGAFMQAIGLARDAKVDINASVEDANKLSLGKSGWCYLGERSSDGWVTRNVDFPGQGLPSSGDAVTVTLPLNVRSVPAGGDLIGVAHAGQRLRIEELQNKENYYWAKATVVQ